MEKKHLKQEQQAITVNLPEIDMLTFKTIYKSLIDCQKFPPPTAEKRLIECGFDIHERQKIYSLPFLMTKEIKLSILQYKIIHNILYNTDHVMILRRFDPLSCSLKRVHAGIFMLACALFNEQDKGSNPLSIISWSVLGKQNVQAKKVYCLLYKRRPKNRPLIRIVPHF